MSFLRAGRNAVAGLAAALAVFLVAGALARDIEVASTLRYLGRLTPADNPDVNVLPAGAAVATLLVARGQEVRAGQTLATYDVAAMRAEQERLRAERAAAAAMRECLIGAADGERGSGRARLDGLATLAEAERLAAESALARCRAEAEAAGAEAARLSAAVAAVTGDLAAVRRNLALLQGAAAERDAPAASLGALPPGSPGGRELSPPGGPAGRAAGTGVGELPRPALLTRAVALLAAQHRLTARLAALRAEARGARARVAASRAARIEDLTRRIGAMTRRIARIERALAAPRLHAARAGTVVRVRQVPPGQVQKDALALVETQDLTAQGFRAAFLAPVGDAALMTVGRPVVVRLVGFDDRLPPLQGRIGLSAPKPSDEAPTGGAAGLRVTVILSPAAQRLLTDPAHGIALRGSATAATIEIAHAPRRLGEAVGARLESWQRAFASGPLPQQIAAGTPGAPGRAIAASPDAVVGRAERAAP